MHGVLHGKILHLAVVVRVVLMKNRNGAAVACDVDAAQTRIKLDYVGTAGHFEKRDGRVLVEIEHRHQLVSLTREEGTMVFRVERHAVVALAFPDWIAPDNLVRCRINDSENVLVLQVHIHLARDGIVLRHSGFTVEM